MHSFYKLGKCLSFQIKPSSVSSLYSFQTRCAALYGPCNLGVDKYGNARDELTGRMNDVADNFRSKMNDFMKEGSTNMVFTEDLKTMLHLFSKTDIELLTKMMKKFNAQSKEIRFGNFIFGPVVMRAYYFFNLPKEALKAFKDPELAGFFDQLMSYHILMDLLYKNDMFDEVMEVFEYVQSKQTYTDRFPRHLLVLAMGALYKQNTKEALERAIQIWSSLSGSSHQPMRRTVMFLGGLALNQGQPHIALEVLSSHHSQTYYVLKNLKIHALSDLNRPDDAFPLIRSTLEFDGPKETSTFFIQEVMERLQASVERSGNNDIKREFTTLFKALTERNMIDSKQSIDDLLCREMVVSQPLIRTQNEQTDLRQSYNRQGGQSTNRPRQQARYGLTDRY